MVFLPFNVVVWVFIILAGAAHAHMAAWHPGMYCRNGPDPAHPNYNTDDPVNPLYNLTYEEYWMHHINKCDEAPPPDGVFLDLPAGGTFTVEHAENQAFTSLTPYAKLTPWGDGKIHPEPYSITNLGNDEVSDSGCISSPNLHAQNESMAQGTAFAISYESDVKKVTLENLVVFTVLPNTPWKRIATYEVPADLPLCPPLGCLGVSVWIPYRCGQSNIYIGLFRMRVLRALGMGPPKAIGKPKAPVLCEKNPATCVKGPKQIMIWHQLEGNNIVADGIDPKGNWETPRYNEVCGFAGGAQNDIFVDPDSPDALFPVGNASQYNTTMSASAGSGAPTSADLGSGASNIAYGTPMATGPATSGWSAASGTPTTDSAFSASGTDWSNPASGTPIATDPGAPSWSATSGTPSTIPSGSANATHPALLNTPTSSQRTCKHGGHKRMTAARREKHNVF